MKIDVSPNETHIMNSFFPASLLRARESTVFHQACSRSTLTIRDILSIPNSKWISIIGMGESNLTSIQNSLNIWCAGMRAGLAAPHFTDNIVDKVKISPDDSLSDRVEELENRFSFMDKEIDRIKKKLRNQYV